MRQLLDINGKPVKVGDVILIGRGCNLNKHRVLGITSTLNLKLSCTKITYNNFYTYKKGNDKDLSTQTSSFYLNMSGRDFLILNS